MGKTLFAGRIVCRAGGVPHGMHHDGRRVVFDDDKAEAIWQRGAHGIVRRCLRWSPEESGNEEGGPRRTGGDARFNTVTHGQER